MAAWLSWLEQSVHTRQVVGSNLTAATIYGPVVKRSKTSPFHGGNTSSILVGVTIIGSIAQLGEHLPYKQRVIGSSPIVPTNKKARIYSVLLYWLTTNRRTPIRPKVARLWCSFLARKNLLSGIKF